ncbi:hypothetical protein DFH29DRAFT_979579 [Suillus ampliporus]|nr:hypothetical protein DFH29DRAFT_979579 [Suillus ampliporus]
MFAEDDIKVEHHPNSGIKTKVYAFEEFQRRPVAATSDPPPNKKPWLPFKSQLEFEVAQIALEAALNNEQTDRLIKICRRCAIGKDKFTFENHKDIHKKWDAVSQCVTGFMKEVILMMCEDKSLDFEVHYRDLWEWAADLLRDPCLFLHMTFDAQRLSKFDGKNFVQFMDEPYTAETFWDFQLQLPEGAKPLTFILYADKTKLSSSGAAKAYPVIARLANLPTDIHNGEGIGGGYVVGWLPIVFSRILSSLTSKSNTGQWFECLDHLSRWFFPSILILSADYEEQCVMLLIQGVRSLWPCPICLVPRDALSDASKRYPLRTSKGSQAIVNLAQTKHTLEEREKTLKEYGLCDVDNSLWLIRRTDLHFRDGGLFDDHLWVKFQKFLNGLGRDAVSQIDKRFKEFPRWHNQKHPNQVMDIAFTDSSIPENISKDKGWNFPKLHMDVHFFDDIEAKGVTRNYNTKLNEKMHGPLKDSYLLRTNFRNVAEQVMLFFHYDMFDAADDLIPLTGVLHVKVGSKQPPQTFDSVENITEFRFLKVNYESMVDWRQHTDYLRCSPQFFGAPRFNCVFIQMTPKKVIFGRLLFVFECTVGKHTFPLALMHPFDAPTGRGAAPSHQYQYIFMLIDMNSVGSVMFALVLAIKQFGNIHVGPRHQTIR